MDDFEKYYISAVHFLSFRQRSEKEVRDNLLRKNSLRHSGKPKAHPESNEREDDSGQARMTMINQVITKLKEQKFVNDLEFARMWIESRTRFKPRAIKLIILELKQKGISQDIIDSLTQNPELRTQNDLEQAKELVRKKLPKYKNLQKQELYQKLGGFLARWGFDWETIKKSIDEVLEEGV